MGLLDRLWGRNRSSQRSSPQPAEDRRVRLGVEPLEDRTVPTAMGTLTAGTLTVTGTFAAYEQITLSRDPLSNEIVLSDGGVEQARFPSALISSITVQSRAGLSIVRVADDVLQPAILQGGPGTNHLFGGGGPTSVVAGPGVNRLRGGANNDILDGSAGATNTLFAGAGNNLLAAGPGNDFIYGARDRDVLIGFDPAQDRDFRQAFTPLDLESDFLGLQPSSVETLTEAEVGQLLQRAAGASFSEDAIIAIVDRGGRILGVRVEGGVSPTITGNPDLLTYAIDGAVAKARTGAFFASNQAPLTSRTIQFISQSTITQREVEAIPSIADANSTLRGPGYVAPIGLGGHFPPGVQFTPQVDLFQIEGTNRDASFHPGPSGISGAADSIFLPERFNIDPAFIPNRIPIDQRLAPIDSYGVASGQNLLAQPRGMGTLPGGIPIYKNGVLVGGIGVFFPGETGFANEENSSLSIDFNPALPDRSMEAEFIAFAALGGSSQAGFPVGEIAGIALPAMINPLPFGRIDLVGITLPLFGPGGLEGPANLARFGLSIPQGNPNTGFNAPLLFPGPDNRLATGDEVPDPDGLLGGTPVPEGFLVTPHDGVGVSEQQIRQIIAESVNQARITRAAIRLPLDSPTSMIIAVTDLTGEVVGLFRMPDATIFSIDVAVAKGRNVAYYADANQLQPIDQLPGVPPGTAFTNRTYRYLSEPFFPEGIDGAPPAPFSLLNDGGVDLTTGLNVGPPLPASAFFNSVLGHDAFFPETNFHSPFNILNQDGIVFFPGSNPLYANGVLIGGLGISGDGVDQDDVVSFAGAQAFTVPLDVLRADEVFVSGIRLPYQKFNRQPLLEPPRIEVP
jgi:uncharacterized protein GlcG (DUF336 family)